MRILYCVRLFSGLQSSVAAGAWRPTGVPTIYKMMEALDAGPDEVAFMLACKDGNVDWPETRNRRITLAGLTTPVDVLAGVRRFPRWLGPGRSVLRGLAHFAALWRAYRRMKPDLVYLDHANIYVAGLFALVTRARIVFRVMGVYPVMRAAVDGKSLRLRFMRWCYRRPWMLAICTQDGSGVEPWLDGALREDVPRVALINGIDRAEGVDTAPEIAAIPAGKTVVLSVGKLEPEKGALQFAEGFLEAWRQRPETLLALIVGTGQYRDRIRAMAEAAGAAGSVTMIDRLPHKQVLGALERADIYVSLNRLGNLSNANLEAMMTGQCMVFPKAQPALGIDVVTDAILPPGAALRIDSTDDISGLAAALIRLDDNPDERASRGAAAEAAARQHLYGWDRRIGHELAMLRAVATGAEVETVISNPRLSETR